MIYINIEKKYIYNIFIINNTIIMWVDKLKI